MENNSIKKSFERLIHHIKLALNNKAELEHNHNVEDITDITATAAELNVLDGLTATTTELNYVDGVTSNIQTQLNKKVDMTSYGFAYTGQLSDRWMTLSSWSSGGGYGLFYLIGKAGSSSSNAATDLVALVEVSHTGNNSNNFPKLTILYCDKGNTTYSSLKSIRLARETSNYYKYYLQVEWANHSTSLYRQLQVKWISNPIGTIYTNMTFNAPSSVSYTYLDFVNGITGVFNGNGSKLTNLNPENLSSAVSLAKGGTGASDASTARTNLEVYSKSEVDTSINEVDAKINEVKSDVDTFFLDADFAENSKDTLKEIQEYMVNDTAVATQIMGDITDLKDEVSINYNEIAFDTKGPLTTVEVDLRNYQRREDNDLTTENKTIVGAINELSSEVANEAVNRETLINEVSNNIAQLSNPNLLINSDWRTCGMTCVNQRGLSNYVGHWQNRVYTIDRWHIGGGSNQMSVKCNSYSITLTSTGTTYQWFGQVLEEGLKEGTYTISVNVKSMTSSTYVLFDNNYFDLQVGLNTFTVTTKTSTDNIYIILHSAGTTELEYIKLEQGSIATPLVPRSYGEELALCQRYYRKIQRGTKTIFTPICVTSVRTARTALDFSMRMTPTINVSSCYTRTSSWKSITNYISCEIDNNSNVIVVMLEFDTDVYPGNCYADSLIIDGYMSFDAEIY